MKTEFRTNKKFNLKKGFHKPYFKNRISITSEFYPSDKSSKSLVRTGATGTFDIKLSTLATVFGVFMLISVITSKIKSLF